MIYDTFEVKGNCKGCGKATEWHINGDYPVCNNCMTTLISDFHIATNFEHLPKSKEDDYLNCINEIAQYISNTKNKFSFEARYAILNIIEKYDENLGLRWKADVRN